MKKEEKGLGVEEQKEIARKKFEEGYSNKEIAEEYGVCSRTIVRIGNKYREGGYEGFEKRKKESREESLEEKVKRLERENAMMRDLYKVFNELSKKK